MKERPILFSAPMVRSRLAGTKTQTRRPVKPQPPQDVGAILSGLYHPTVVDRHGEEQPGPETFGAYSEDGRWASRCPYGQPGDRLWVREAFRFPASLDRLSPSSVGEKAMAAGYRTPWAPTQYEADCERTGEWHGFDTPPAKTVPGKLRPGMFMPRWASRTLLDVNAVRVERLQDISREDAMAEGIVIQPDGGYGLADTTHYHATDPRQSYFSLWEAINGRGSVEANPWVWAVTFAIASPNT